MFVTIIHTDNQQFLANANCPIVLFLYYLRTKLDLPPTEVIDVCDDKGSLKLLWLKNSQDNASKLLSARGTYYICQVERSAADNGFRYIKPLLTDPSQDILDVLYIQCECLEKTRQRFMHQRAADNRKLPQYMDSMARVKPSARSWSVTTGSNEEDTAAKRGPSGGKTKVEGGRKGGKS
nr:PREDICTED: uncharacterized protein CXorf65 homolog isoform X2 [Latimeria chalumnae]|eukprot:XP_014348632.1 PREDICTED: uncharacterized protein CXorf65 homolog isoform X2 [Latimeria chalumnae]